MDGSPKEQTQRDLFKSSRPIPTKPGLQAHATRFYGDTFVCYACLHYLQDAKDQKNLHSHADKFVSLWQIGDDFSAACTSYIKRFIAKGIPSLFSDLKGLYNDKSKVAALQEIFEGLREQLEAGATDVPGLTPADCGEPSADNPSPLVIIAALASLTILCRPFRCIHEACWSCRYGCSCTLRSTTTDLVTRHGAQLPICEQCTTMA